MKPITDNVVTLTSLIRKLSNDPRLLTTHVCLANALFVCWQQCTYQNPFRVTRKELMVNTKFTSIVTYHKCIRDLHNFGYIRYQPSYMPGTGSLVYWTEKSFSSENNAG